MSRAEHIGRRALEWPTVLVAVAVYGGWLAATYFHDLIYPALLPLAGGWLLAWQGSLQHETIHGHPTPWRRVNAALGYAPLSLWLPYDLYRRSHLAHHASRALTEPGADPESRYLAPGRGIIGAAELIAHRLTAPLIGRLLLGPLLEIGRFWTAEALAVARGDRERRTVWIGHIFLCALLVAWLHVVCGLSLGRYILMFVYPGAALSLLRSFAEHRADPLPGRRIGTVERAPILGLLYLNNNLHAAHHHAPSTPWFDLPRRHAALREGLIRDGAPLYRGYGEVFGRFLLRPHDRIIHPRSTAAVDRAVDQASTVRADP